MSHRYKTILIVSLPCLLLFGFVPTSQAAYRYWTGDTGNWSDPANWDVAEPTSSDYAYIYNGGTAYITQPGAVCEYLLLGDSGEGNSGAVEMTGGSLSSRARQFVGHSGVGTFTHSGGTNTVGETLYIGHNGTYRLSESASQLLVHKSLGVGNQGAGTFTQSNGTNTISEGLTVGSGSSGTYNLNGGQLSAQTQCVGGFGTGIFNHSGGTNNTNELKLGYRNTGIYNLSGTGQLLSESLYLGDQSTGIFTQSGGTYTISDVLYLGYNFRCSDDADGTYNLSGGQLSAPKQYIGSEYASTSVFQQTGGTNTATDVSIGKSGIYELNGGTLVVSSITTVSESATFNFGGGTLKASDNMDIALPMKLTGTGGDANVDTNGYAVTLSSYAQLSGTGGLNKLGNGALTLSAANTYTGDTIIREGTLTLANGNALQNSTLDYNGYGGSLSFGSLTSATFGGLKGNQDLALTNATSGNVTLVVGKNNASTVYSGLLNGGGRLIKVGDGSLTLSAANTYSGGTILTYGQLNINNAAALGTGTFTIISVSSGVNTIDNTSGAAITLSTNNAQAWDADLTFAGSSNLDLGNGAVTLGGNRQVTVGANTLTVGGAIGGDYSLTKAGGGTLALGGANAYTGNTTISAGTLKLGSEASLASGAIDVAAGATFDVSEVSGGYNLMAGQTLNGAGAVSGDITINGIHAPGYSPGIQTVEGDYNMLGELQVELAGTAPGADYDQVLLSGSGDYNATLGGTLTLDWTGFADSSEETQLWIIQNDTDGILTGEFDDYANGSSLGVHDDLEWWIWYGADAAAGALTGGNDVLIGAVPEPSMLVLIGIAAIALSANALRRRKLNRGLV